MDLETRMFTSLKGKSLNPHRLAPMHCRYSSEVSPEIFKRGLDILKIDKFRWFIVFHVWISGAWKLIWGGISPPKPPWRWDWYSFKTNCEALHENMRLSGALIRDKRWNKRDMNETLWGCRKNWGVRPMDVIWEMTQVSRRPCLLQQHGEAAHTNPGTFYVRAAQYLDLWKPGHTKEHRDWMALSSMTKNDPGEPSETAVSTLAWLRKRSTQFALA